MMARTVCCNALINTDTAPVARNNGRVFLVCSQHRNLIQTANKAQMERLLITL